MSKAADPRKDMGVYRSIDDVPDFYQLHHYADSFEGQDVWAEFVATRNFESESQQRRFKRVGESWEKSIQNSQTPHHALAHPDDVESWVTELLQDRTRTTVYYYWRRLEAFYRWMMMSCDYPHVYSPVMMAVVNGTECQKMWEFQVSRR